MKRFIRMNEKDMVATALEDTHKGEEAGIHDADNNFLCSVTALEDIPFGNKIALTGAVPGERVVKYGAVIGECTRAFQKGMLVHVHNVKSLAVDIPPAFKKEIMRQMHITVEEDGK